MAPNAIAASAGSDRSNVSWLKLYSFDLVTLVLTTALSLKLWWAYLGLHDRLLLSVAIVASLVETVRRIVVAKRHGQRPATFFSDRRSDLLAGILLGTGPWPMLPALGPALSWESFGLPVWIRLFVFTGAMVFTANRLMAALEPRTPIRQLTAVPAGHIASMLVLPCSVTR